MFFAIFNNKSLTFHNFIVRSNLMKRCFLPLSILLFITGFALAQPGPQNQAQLPPGPDSGPGQPLSAVTIKGPLSFVNSQIAVKSAGTTYYVRGLNRLFGFVDGLKEGAEVTLEGYAIDIPIAPEYKYFLVDKLTFNGKEYADLLPQKRMARAFSPGGMMNGHPRMNQMPPSFQYRHNEKRRDRDNRGEPNSR
jgi:hypothetical protein